MNRDWGAEVIGQPELAVGAAMRTITYGGAVSLDGFLAAADGALDWLHMSRDAQQIMADYWKHVDAILMGRKTYDVAVRMRSGGAEQPNIGPVRTYVFSRTLPAIHEPRTQLVREDAAEFVRGLKEQPGGEICLMGGGELAQSLLAAGLVDRIGLNIHPILLGAGVPVFRDPGHRVRLELVECRPLDGGCILANYAVSRS